MVNAVSHTAGKTHGLYRLVRQKLGTSRRPDRFQNRMLSSCQPFVKAVRPWPFQSEKISGIIGSVPTLRRHAPAAAILRTLSLIYSIFRSAPILMRRPPISRQPLPMTSPSQKARGLLSRRRCPGSPPGTDAPQSTDGAAALSRNNGFQIRPCRRNHKLSGKITEFLKDNL